MRRYVVAILFTIATVLVVIQVFVPPIIGLASNGDFPKLLGRYSLGPIEPVSDNFIYFVQFYRIDPKFHWESGHVSSERLAVLLALQLFRWTDGTVFDIRWMGAIHGVLFLTAFALLCRRLRLEAASVQWITGLAAIWFFTDVLYVSYFNSFYMDAGAIVVLLILMALLVDAGSPLVWLSAAGVACLLITAKSQHTPIVLALAPFFAYSLYKANQRALAISVPAILLVCAAVYAWQVPAYWKATALYNVIFCQILPYTPDPSKALIELNLDDSYLKYAGMTAFEPGSPVDDPSWRGAFHQRCDHATLLRYYLRHPGAVLGTLNYSLVFETRKPRQFNLSNYTRAAGHPAGALTNSFDSWSSFRSWVYRHVPYWVIAWFLGLAYFVRRPIVYPLIAIATIEFCVASLLDALETSRHLLLFHLTTDITILLGVFEIARRINLRASAG